MIPQTVQFTPPPIPITRAKLLVAEGSTPMHFLEALLRVLGISEMVEVRNFGGLGELTKKLRALQASAGFENVTSLGIVRDAEDNAANARQSVENALGALAIIGRDQAKIKASIFILPDNSRPGMIEDLCLDAVRQQPVYRCVEQFMQCAGAVGAPIPTGLKRAKSYSQAYLATRSETQMFPGIAAHKNYWPFEGAVFDDLKAFLQAL